MDRREAREFLESMKLIDSRFAPKSKATEALDLAIEALGQTGILRCKDCVYCNVVNTKDAYAYCMKHRITFYPFEDDTRTNYCSWGEIKNKGDAESATTTDSISRQQAIEVVSDICVDLLESLPPVEPERPKGEWIVYPLTDDGRVELECPECGDTLVRAIDYKPHFCENCGADMRGEE